jgi:hypothetical protein
MSEQRNPYKGSPLRPWVRLNLVAADGTTKEIEALADTGSPCALIVSSQVMRDCNLGLAPGMSTNFGALDGGWLRIRIPGTGLDQVLLAYASDGVVQSVQDSHSDFQSLAGLPLLMLLEYGGDGDAFWVRATS